MRSLIGVVSSIVAISLCGSLPAYSAGSNAVPNLKSSLTSWSQVPTQSQGRDFASAIAGSLFRTKFSPTPVPGSPCDGQLHGNTLVQKGSSLYLCDRNVWVYWRAASNSTGNTQTQQKPDVKPGQNCSPVGKKVASKSNGNLICSPTRVGRLIVPRWIRN